MKKIILIFCLFLAAVSVQAQSNDCSTATTITPGATCVNTAGTTSGATQSLPGCVGTADDDVWYQFTAGATSHQITVTPSASFDPVVQLFSGACSGLTTISCMDNGLTNEAETIFATGLTIGQVYKIRVYHYYSGVPATTTFSICVTNPPPVPGNNNCSGATALTVNAACSATAGTTLGANQSSTGCAGTADDDVWYSFTATNAVQTITVDPSVNMDPVIELFSGTCASLTSITCMDNGFMDGNEVISAVGLIPGNTYFVRVYDYYSSTGGAPFTICVTGTATSAPVNDEPCNGINLPTVTTACNYLTFTTTGATTTATPGTPSATCQNWDNGTSTYAATTTGAFGAGTKDVWFRITVPATGNITITIQPGLASPTNDMVFALYTGACGSLTQIACSDDYNYPGSANDLQPFLNQTGLTPGATVYLRVYCYGTTNFGNFGLCVTTNTNDACANALYICDLNGYSASTSAAFTADRPGTGAGQMYGNNETAAGVNQPDGTNTNGPFGFYPPSNIAGTFSSPAIDVNIENNSWIRFTAGATTAVLNVSVGNCFVGGYPSGGIQMQIFSATACDNFTPVSQFRENSTGFTITASGLTVGNDYYLMVDGYARDVCNYTISANSGVQFPDIIASANPICSGASTLLTAPAGATAYEWLPGGATTQTVSVSPSSTTTYTCFVSGVCGQRQTLTKTITVNQLPSMTSSTAPAAICSGASVGLTLTSDIPSTYSWLAASNTDVTGETTSATVSGTISNTLTVTSLTNEDVVYTVTPTSNAANGSCPGTAQTVTITVKPRPTVTDPSDQSICAGSAVAATNFSTNISGTTVAWVNSGSTTAGIGASGSGDISGYTSPTVASVQNIIITATPTLNSCAGLTPQTFTITVNPTPQFTASVGNQSVCGGANTPIFNFNTYSPSSGGSIAWTNSNTNAGTTGVGITSGSGSGNIAAYTTPLVTATQTTVISATPTIGSCSGTAQSFTLTVNPTPVLSTVTSQTVCGGGAVSGVNFSTTPVATVNWTNSNTTAGVNGIGFTTASGSGNISSFTSPLVTSQQTGTFQATPVLGSCTGTSRSYTVTVNPTPVLAATGTTVCGGATVVVPSFTVSPSSTVNWTNGNTAIGSLAASGSNNIPNFTAATPVVTTSSTFTASTTLNGCPSNSPTFTITVNPTPVLSAISSQTVCGGAAVSTINFSTTPAATVNWTNSNSSAGVNGIGLTSATGSGTINTYTSPLVTTAQTGVIVATPTLGACPGTAQQFTINVNPTPVITAVTNTTVCGNTLVSAVNFSASPTTSVSWTSSSTSTGLSTVSGTGSIPAFTSANVGSVTTSTVNLNATLNSCAATQVPYTITVNPLPTLTVTPTETQSACGLSTGALNGASAAGSGALNYVWTNSVPAVVGGTANITNMPAGSYNLTVTDANCAAAFGPFSITNPGAPAQPTASATDATLCVGEALSLTASSTEVNPTFAWSGPNSSSATNALSIGTVTLGDAGTYTVTVTVSNCTSTNTVAIVVNPNPVAVASNASSVYCSGGNVDLFGSGGSGYAWTGPASYTSTTQNPQLTPSTTAMSGTYTLTATDAQGCVDTATTSILINQTPGTPAITALPAGVCVGDTINLNATSTGAVTYAWTGPNSFTSAQQNPTINTVGVLESGTYTVIGTALNCSSVASSVTITVNANPVVTTGISGSPVCSGGNVTLSANGGTNYSWTGPNTFTSGSQNPLLTPTTVQMSGTYTVQVTDANSCSTIDSIALVVNPTPGLPVITASANTLCEGQDLQLDAISTSAVTYSWSGPNGFSSPIANPLITGVTVLMSGTYTVTASANNCSSPTETVAIVVNAMPVASATISSATICSGNTIDLNSTGGTTFIWDGPNGYNSSQANNTLNNVAITASGTYTFTAINPGNCTDTATVSLIVNPTPGLPVITASSNNLCEGEDLQLDATSTNATNYTWGGPNGFTAVISNPMITDITVLASGTYTVTASTVNCTSPTETVTINVNPTPVAAAFISATNTCSGNSVDLNSTGGSSFSWTGPNGYTSTQANNTITNITVAATGTYTFTAINAGNCTDTATVSVNVVQTPASPVVSGDSTCVGTPLELVASGNGTISWYTDAALTNFVSNSDTLYPNLPANTAAMYYVTISNNGCTSVSSVVGAASYNVNASFNASALSGYAPLPVTFTNTSTGVDGSDLYNWSVSNSVFANTFNSSYDFTQGGTFNVMLTIVDSPSGCMDTASVTIVIEDEIRVIIPNVFTPNGDGINDGFIIDIKGAKEAEGTILNRWGQVLYQWDAVNVVWDGKLANGEKVTDGIYFYIIRATGFNGKTLDVPGHVTIVR